MDDRDVLRVEQGRRLRAARLKAGFKSAAKAVNASPARAKWKNSTYNAHERGSRTIGQDDAERYAKLFRDYGVEITAIDIMFGDNAHRKVIADGPTLDDLADLVKELAEEVRGRRPVQSAPGPIPLQPKPKAPPRGLRGRKK